MLNSIVMYHHNCPKEFLEDHQAIGKLVEVLSVDYCIWNVFKATLEFFSISCGNFPKGHLI